jgi:hypothetical protein
MFIEFELLNKFFFEKKKNKFIVKTYKIKFPISSIPKNIT